jgi:DNA-binding MarR family transcriptional regulator
MAGPVSNSERIVREVLKLLPEISKALSRMAPEHAPGPGVSMAQVKALVHLAQYGPETMGELASGLRITTPSATGLVGPLVEAGYVVRRRDTVDRRVVEVRLSPEAQEFADQILAVRRLQVEAALSGMDAEAQAHFLQGLENLAEVFGGDQPRVTEQTDA